jgi:DNA repair exonuclease SbcCD nuclease subunit
MTIKIVVTSDWHLDAITAGKRRHAEITTAIEQSVDFANEHEVDFYINLGDLTNPDTVRSYSSIWTAMDVRKRLNDDIYYLLVTGNHDVIEDGSGDHTMIPLYYLENTKVFDCPNIWGLEETNIVALPFTPSSHEYSPTNFIEHNHQSLEPSWPTIVLGHLNIEGITPGSESTDMPRGRDVFLPVDTIRKYIPNAVILNGHYHKQQVFNRVHIPGSVARLTFGEADNKLGFLYLEI